MPSSSPVLALDVGGTKIAAAFLTVSPGQDAFSLSHRCEIRTLAEEGPQEVMRRVASLAQEMLSVGNPTAIGVAYGSQIDPDSGHLVYATDNLPGWAGFSISKYLSGELGLPTFVDNDVNCFTLAEARFGAGRGYRHLFLAAVGTGIGGGVLIEGQLYRGSLGGAGEVGQMIVNPASDRECSGGKLGCLEAYAASSEIVARSGYASIQEVAAAYTTGAAIEAVEEAALWLGRTLVNIAYVLSPQVFLIGGSVGLLGERYLQAVRRAYQANVLPSHQAISILPTQLGPDSGLAGAGLLAWMNSP